jgi:hypothetical protein
MSENLDTNLIKTITGLFKYFPADKLVFFENRLVLLTPPKFLNDPWDFLPKGKTPTDEEIIKEWQKLEKEIAQSSTSSTNIPVWFAQLQQKERLQRMFAAGKSREFVEGLPKYSQERVSTMYGIVALTEKPLCRLMWAHYAESHAGFVAEFATTQHFVEPEEKLTCCSCMGFPAAKVKYPPIFEWHPWTSDNIVSQSWSKHPLWEYEQEWRMLLPLAGSVGCCIVAEKNNAPERLCLPFSPEHLTRVIFGMRMKKETQQQLCLMLNRDEFKHVQKQTTDIDNETGELILKPYT